MLVACTSHVAPDELLLDEPTPRDEPRVQTIPPAPEHDPDAEIPADARIELRRSSCYGACPVYDVVLTADGKVRWRGEGYVEKHGDRRAKIPPAEFAALWRRLLVQPFAQLPDRYPGHPSPFCPDYISDHSTATVVLHATGIDETVVDYHGCHGNPTLEAFRPLEDRIDEVAGTAVWIGRCRTHTCRR